MANVIYYHGAKNRAAALEAIIGGDILRPGFHMAPDIDVARNYGAVIAIELEEDLVKAHVGMINKEGNSNAAVGNGIEVVLKDEAAVVELYNNLYDAYPVH